VGNSVTSLAKVNYIHCSLLNCRPIFLS